MSKPENEVVPMIPEAPVAGDKPLALFTANDVRALLQQALGRVNRPAVPQKLVYNEAEAADRLGLPKTWLAEKRRSGEIPHRQLGHYIGYTAEDIDAILEKYKSPRND